MLIARACHGACTLRPDQFDFFAALNRSTAQPLNCSSAQVFIFFLQSAPAARHQHCQGTALEKTTSYPGSVLAKTIKVRK